MKDPEYALNHSIGSRYVKGSFESTDRLAVVLMNKRTSSVIQRISTAARIAAEDFQAWLKHQNAQKYEIYISMNALQPGARGRTKADVAFIRHVYLDFDANGTTAVRASSIGRTSLPPSLVVNTSPDKWQVTWRGEGFTKEQAEMLQRGLARDTGADLAATDCARVLRPPDRGAEHAAKHILSQFCEPWRRFARPVLGSIGWYPAFLGATWRLLQGLNRP